MLAQLRQMSIAYSGDCLLPASGNVDNVGEEPAARKEATCQIPRGDKIWFSCQWHWHGQRCVALHSFISHFMGWLIPCYWQGVAGTDLRSLTFHWKTRFQVQAARQARQELEGTKGAQWIVWACVGRRMPRLPPSPLLFIHTTFKTYSCLCRNLHVQEPGIRDFTKSCNQVEPEFDFVSSKAEFQQQNACQRPCSEKTRQTALTQQVVTYKLCLCRLLSPCTSETTSRACLVPDLGRSPPLNKDRCGFRGLVNTLHIIHTWEQAQKNKKVGLW